MASQQYYKYYKTLDGRYVTDIDSQASELWAIVGPEPLMGSARAISADELPEGFDWLSDDEWSALEGNMVQLTPAEAAGPILLELCQRSKRYLDDPETFDDDLTEIAFCTDLDNAIATATCTSDVR